jgi:hypothetical protein
VRHCSRPRTCEKHRKPDRETEATRRPTHSKGSVRVLLHRDGGTPPLTDSSMILLRSIINPCSYYRVFFLLTWPLSDYYLTVGSVNRLPSSAPFHFNPMCCGRARQIDGAVNMSTALVLRLVGPCRWEIEALASYSWPTSRRLPYSGCSPVHTFHSHPP